MPDLPSQLAPVPALAAAPASARPAPPERPDFIFDLCAPPASVQIAQVRPRWARITDTLLVRRLMILIVLAIAWQAYGQFASNALIFPTLTETVRAIWRNVVHGELMTHTLVSLDLLLKAYVIGVALAFCLVVPAVSLRIGADILATLTAMFNPLPAIALLPLAMLWFGLGQAAIIFVTVHSVLWAVALNTYAGFESVGATIRMAGRNMGLRRLGYVVRLLIPAALPSILSGLRVGWAFAWRTIIAAEMVFGVSSGPGGIGWFIFEKRSTLDTAAVFGGLVIVVLIGLLVESVLFRSIENHTIRKWGMQH